MKKVLVTGGAGFIGSNLCRYLLNKGDYEIISLDNYFTGKKSNHVSGVTYVEGHTKDIDKHISFSPDIIYHLGEYSRVEQSFGDIESVWDNNKVGTFSVLQFALKTSAKLVYAGSSTKFGDGGLGRTQSPYGWTKASNTELVENFGKWYGLPYAIVYFYNAYGQNEITNGKYATLIGLYSEKMRLGKPLTVVKPGTQKRNFTHVDDIVRGVHLVGENGFGDEFGIGSPDAFTIDEVANLFGGEIEYLEPRPGNRLAADVITEKTRSLGWEPEWTLSDYVDLIRGQSWILRW